MFRACCLMSHQNSLVISPAGAGLEGLLTTASNGVIHEAPVTDNGNLCERSPTALLTKARAAQTSTTIHPSAHTRLSDSRSWTDAGRYRASRVVIDVGSRVLPQSAVGRSGACTSAP